MPLLFPVADPGAPRTACSSRPRLAVLWWLVRSQPARILMGITITALWLGTQPLIPLFVGRAVDDGLLAGSAAGLLGWSGALALVVAFQAVSGIASYRFFHRSIIDAQFRTGQVVDRKVGELGAVLPRKVATGEVVTVGSADAMSLGRFAGGLSHIGGALAAMAVVVGILLAQSPILGLLMLGALPVLAFGLWPLFTAIQARRDRQRRDIGAMNTRATDTVAGLRVVRGIGGEATFLRRYTEASQAVRRSGTRLARAQALLQAAGILLPGVLLVGLVWVGGRMAATGEISPGELLAFYGYVVFLIRPLELTIFGVESLAEALVAASRLRAFLESTPGNGDPSEPTVPRPWPGPGTLGDAATGARIRPGRLTAVTADGPAHLEGLADRLARYSDPPAALDGVGLDAYALGDVRRHIHLLAQDAQLFTGKLRDQLDVDGGRSDEEIIRALHTASALDIVGLDPALIEHDPAPELAYDLSRELTERGRGLSGGERQRLMLARALLTEAETLILDEPTSAVDAQTDRRIARRLTRHRRGRTTVVLTTSPLLLAEADEVVFLSETSHSGTHTELLQDPRYAKAVQR
jgi:ABC-type multidrug transport system fused ATPase/permease subunit